MSDNIKGEMIRGHIDTAILLALTDGDKDSNEIRVAIEEKSENQYSVKQGTFYSAMQRLVKQGFIREYRSSALDGIRRKYYSLTPKGNKSLEKNREMWSKSKALIDNLIDTEPVSQPVKAPEEKVEVVDEFERFKELAALSDSEIEIDRPIDDDSYFDKLGNDVLSELNAELEKLSAEEEASSDEENTADAEEALEESLPHEDEKDDKIDEISVDLEEDYESLSDKTSEEIYSFEVIDESTEDEKAFEEESIDQPEIEEIDQTAEDENSDEDEQIEDVYAGLINDEEETELEAEDFQDEDSPEETEVKPEETNEAEDENGLEPEANEEPEEEIKAEEEEEIEIAADEKDNTDDESYESIGEDWGKDDTLIIGDATHSHRHEYKQILNRLLPKDEKVILSEEADESASIRMETYEFKEDVESDAHREDERVEKETAYEESVKTEIVSPVEVKHLPEKEPVRYAQTDTADFSDLHSMAIREGFKVRTSTNTNRFAGTEILINKLRLHSALIFFALMLIEGLVLNFALAPVLAWKPAVKFIILGCLAVYPIITLILYIINKDASVYDISSFKDALSVALIITFQLAILILCVALFVSVDFNNFKEVATFILLPFIFAINIPVYFILKYTLLASGRYFTE